MNSQLTDPQAPVTDEELDQMIWKLERDGGMTPKMLSLMRELREVRRVKGEPVADVVAWSSPNEERTCDIRWRRFDVAPGPLFTTPPVPAEMNSDKASRELKISAEDCQAWSEGWNACRATTLNEYTTE